MRLPSLPQLVTGKILLSISAEIKFWLFFFFNTGSYILLHLSLKFFLEDSQLYTGLGKAHVLGEAKENDELMISKILPLPPFYYHSKDVGFPPST